MSTKTLTGAMIGLNAELVEVEADARGLLTRFYVVGLPDSMVQEARERVKSALKHSGIPFPRGTIVVNLAPADLRKFGTLYDLPIAVALAAQSLAFDEERISSAFFAGELALDGMLRSVNGALSLAALAASRGMREIILPKANAAEAALVPGIAVIGAENLLEVIGHLRDERALKPFPPRKIVVSAAEPPTFNFSCVRGQEQAKRALEIAAAGNHNVLMQGPPGSGKTLLAKCYPSILPPMETSEALEVTRIWSVAGLLSAKEGCMAERPFRAPHHTASGVSLVGGGAIPKPGEISLAHRGVLFLDEFPEFSRPVLENLRQPLEDGIVTVTRIQQTVTFPARFNLIAAMNPCPCGYATDPDRECTCAPLQIASYKKRLSGPLLDRIDLSIEVPKVPTDKLMSLHEGESSFEIRERVIRARVRQISRREETRALTNSELSSEAIRKFVRLSDGACQVLERAIRHYNLSARGYYRTLKVARTIADLADAEAIEQVHVAEALQYRQRTGE